MSTPPLGPTTGIDGVIASGNLPTWIVQEATVTPALTSQSATFPLSALSAADTAFISCLHDMGDVSFTRNATTRERKRACEKVTSQIKTGETINGELTAIFDQQAEMTEDINAAYASVPEGATVYVVMAYGWDASKKPTAETKVDVYRAKVQQRAKNTPVEGEDFEFTATLSADLFLEDIKLSTS